VDATGRQFEIAHGSLRAWVTEVGAGLRRLARGDVEILDAQGPDEMPAAGRGQLLIPWPNRVADGRYRWDGEDQQLPITEVPTGCAIHGLTRWTAWYRVEERPEAVILALAVHPQPGYPFRLDLRAEHRVGPDGYSVTVEAVNAGDRACPYACGAHPYLRLGAARADDLEVHLDAGTVLTVDDRGIPTGTAPVSGDTDFRSPRRVGAAVLDTAFADLARDAEGRAWVHVRAPGGAAASLWLDEAHSHVMLFTGDPQPTVARRSLGVEPMTAPPNAFASGDGLRRLAPGERARASWGIRPA